MNSRLGCFQQGTCLDIGTQEDNPGLSAALCDSIDHTDRCECCEAEGWPPACSDWRSRCGTSPLPAPTPPTPPTPPPSAPSGDEVQISVSEGACDIVNAWRPATPLQCSQALGEKAAARLREGFTPVGCSVPGAPLLPGSVSEILSCGEHVGSCAWADTMTSWLQAKESGARPGHTLLAAGAVRMGCAEASVSRSDVRDSCAARLCLLSPALDVPAYVSLPGNAKLGTCSSACLGGDAECAGLPGT